MGNNDESNGGGTGAGGDCTVLVCSCDKYSDLHGPFITLFRKFWPDCPFEVVLVTETIAGDSSAFNHIVLSGPGKPWCRMLSDALGKVTTPYILLLMDDYLLSAPVDTPRVLRRFEEAKRFSAASLRLVPKPPGKTPLPGSDLLEMPKNQAYCVTCQASIWRRDFLLGLALKNNSAWEFERRGSFDVGDETRPLLVTPTQEFPFVDAVHKGYWEKAGLALCMANGVAVDLARRTRPPILIRAIEALKSIVFAVAPLTPLVRLQNKFGLGAKEKRK